MRVRRLLPQIAIPQMAIQDQEMDISVTEFKARCLDLIRKVEKSVKTITIRRHGRVVARLEPAGSSTGEGRPWEQLRALGGRVRFKADESVLMDEDFEALN